MRQIGLSILMHTKFKNKFLLLDWVPRDAWLIMVARCSRVLGQSSIAVLLGIYLNSLGFNLMQIGSFISVGLAGGAVFSLVVALFSNIIGRRKLLTIFAVATGISGLLLTTTDNYLLLITIAFLGSFSMAGPASGPIQPLEQASISQTIDSNRRTDLFALYGILSSGATAIGTLASGLPVIFQTSLGIHEATSFRLMFFGFAICSIFAGLMYALLSSDVEISSGSKRWSNPLTLPSKKMIFTLAGLFSLDSAATRLIVQSLVALWFYSKFDIELSSVAVIFFGSHLASATSLWVAAKLANRIGLLNTMVFTHIPAVAILFIVPMLSSASLAAILWLIRGFFSLMDVPTKQSYTMAIVSPEERSAMAGLQGVGQNLAGTISPFLATILWSTFAAWVPFFFSGTLKALYLSSLYFQFRKVPTPEEANRSR